MFHNTDVLAKLVLGNSFLSLSADNALEGSAIAKGQGYVYVPNDMVARYKADSVWGKYANQIKPMSEYIA